MLAGYWWRPRLSLRGGPAWHDSHFELPESLLDPETGGLRTPTSAEDDEAFAEELIGLAAREGTSPTIGRRFA